MKSEGLKSIEGVTIPVERTGWPLVEWTSEGWSALVWSESLILLLDSISELDDRYMYDKEKRVITRQIDTYILVCQLKVPSFFTQTEKKRKDLNDAVK